MDFLFIGLAGLVGFLLVFQGFAGFARVYRGLFMGRVLLIS